MKRAVKSNSRMRTYRVPSGGTYICNRTAASERTKHRAEVKQSINQSILAIDVYGRDSS